MKKKLKKLPSYRSLKAEDRLGAISAAIFFVGLYIHSFGGSKFNSLSSWLLGIRSLYMKGLVYIQYGKIHVLFSHPGWVGLNTETKTINWFPPLNYFNG